MISEMAQGLMIPLGWSAINAAGFPLVRLGGPEWVDVGAEPRRVSEFLREELANGGRRIDAHLEDLRRAGVSAGVSVAPIMGLLGVDVKTGCRPLASVSALSRCGQERWEIEEKAASGPPLELGVRQHATFGGKEDAILQLVISGALGAFARPGRYSEEETPLLEGPDILGNRLFYGSPVEAFVEIGARLTFVVPTDNWNILISAMRPKSFSSEQPVPYEERFLRMQTRLSEILTPYFPARDGIFLSLQSEDRLGAKRPEVALSLDLTQLQTFGGLLTINQIVAHPRRMPADIVGAALAIVKGHLPPALFPEIDGRRTTLRLRSGQANDERQAAVLPPGTAQDLPLPPADRNVLSAILARMCNSYEDLAAFAQDEFHVDMGDICLSSPRQSREWLAGEVIAYLDRRSVGLDEIARAIRRHWPSEDFRRIIARVEKREARRTSGPRPDVSYGLYVARKIAERHGVDTSGLPKASFDEAPPPAGPPSRNPVLAHAAARIDRERLIAALAELFNSAERAALLSRAGLRADQVAGFERARNNEEQARAMVEYLDGADRAALVQLYNMARIERPRNSGLPEL